LVCPPIMGVTPTNDVGAGRGMQVVLRQRTISAEQVVRVGDVGYREGEQRLGGAPDQLLERGVHPDEGAVKTAPAPSPSSRGIR